MNKLFVDTNIVLDLLAQREEFYQEAQELFSLADNQLVELYVSVLTIANTHYILARKLGSEKARKVLIKFRLLAKTLSVTEKIIDLALASDFKDFEDAIQYHCALENGTEYIITRDKKDFRNAQLPIYTAREYLNL